MEVSKNASRVKQEMPEGEVLIHTFWFCSKFYLKSLHLGVPSLFLNVIWEHMLLHANEHCIIIWRTICLDFRICQNCELCC